MCKNNANNIQIFRFYFSAVFFLVIIFSCEKRVWNPPTVGDVTANQITSTSATLYCDVKKDGGFTLIKTGICWYTTPNPTISNFKKEEGPNSWEIISELYNLNPGTIYYVRGYASNVKGITYGNQSTFITKTALPILLTLNVWSITTTTAICGGNITSDGGLNIISKGVCWSTSQNPTISNNKITIATTGIGNFSSSITGLSPAITYHIRAFATNSLGTEYGNNVSFTTSPDMPTVSTSSITSITSNTASSGGNITNDGGSSVTARGVCWSTISNPTILNSKTTDGTGIGSFTSSMTGLSSGTTYNVRAYATNTTGTAYGTNVTFTTTTNLPTITTTSIESITSNTASSGGNITNDGGSSVTARGVCWSTISNPTILNSKTTDGTGIGSFTSSMTGLSAGTTYYVRSYATNSIGTAYGGNMSFTTVANNVTDVDGNVYNIVTIGTQVWMKENLKTTKFRNNNSIGTTTPSTLDISNSTIYPTPKYQWAYAGNEINVATYGRLYTWYAVTDNRGLCPTGWHVPSDVEWSILVTFLGGDGSAGGKVKEIGSVHWSNPNTGATNSSGFTALPSGNRNTSGNYSQIGNGCYFWSTTEDLTTTAFYRELYYNNSILGRFSLSKIHGFSVRCVKD